MKFSVKSVEMIIVNGADHEGAPHYGGNQDWYSSPWRRGSGCGPTTIATVTSYMQRASCARAIEKSEFVAHMNDIWRFVTPTMFGLPKTSQVRRRVERLIAVRGFPSNVEELDVPENTAERPSFCTVAAFIAESLARDVPVAFLCLDNGGQEELDNWHWTTLVTLDDETRQAEIIDSGRRFTIDLGRWIEDTTKGGGFVSLH